MLDTLEAFLFVDPFVESDLSEKVGKRMEVPIDIRKNTFERLGRESLIFADKLHIFMLRVILEVGIQGITQGGLDDIKDPAEVIIKESHDLGQHPILKKILTEPLLMDQFFQD